MAQKIVIIGAAGRSGPGLVESFVRAVDLAGRNIMLYDINVAHLELPHLYAEAKRRAAGANLQFGCSRDLREGIAAPIL